MTILSLWVKNPITSHSKDTSLVGVRCDTEEDLFTMIRLRQYDGGFIIKEVDKKIIYDEGNYNFVEYELKCLTGYAEQHKDSNQALWVLTVLVMEEKKND